MIFLPCDNINITTQLTPIEIQERITRLVAVETHQFNGYIFNNVFKIQRITTFGHASNPEIEGVVEKTESGSRIKLRISTSSSILIFMLLFAVVCLIGGIIDIVDALKRGERYSVLPFIIGFGVYFLWAIAFKAKSKKVKETLIQILEGQ